MACCSCCSLKAIGCFGGIFSILFGLVAVAGIVVGGLQFSMLNFSWVSSTNWSALGIIAIVAIVIIAVATVFGIIHFCCCDCKKKCCCNVIYLIVELIVLLFAMAIAILGLVSSAIGSVEELVGCNSNYTGILSVWANLDGMFKYLDYGLCSFDCQCKFLDDVKQEFKANATVAPVFDNWKINGEMISLFNCSAVESKIEKAFNATLADKKDYINVTKFGDYWKIIEEQFDCTGWCEKTYTLSTDLDGTPISPWNGGFYKYLYAGINRGIVKNVGCLRSIAEWLPPLIQAYGIVGLVAAILCFFTWILALMLLCNCYKEKAMEKQKA